MKSLTRMRLHPLYSQLGVGVDLEGSLVAEGSKISRMRSLQLRILKQHQKFNRVQQLYLRLYRLCSLHFSRELRI